MRLDPLVWRLEEAEEAQGRFEGSDRGDSAMKMAARSHNNGGTGGGSPTVVETGSGFVLQLRRQRWLDAAMIEATRGRRGLPVAAARGIDS